MTNRKLARRFAQVPADLANDRYLLRVLPSARLLYLVLWVGAQAEGGMDSFTLEQAQRAVVGLPKVGTLIDALEDAGLVYRGSIPGLWHFCDLPTWVLPAAQKPGATGAEPGTTGVRAGYEPGGSGVRAGYEPGATGVRNDSRGVTPVTGERQIAAQDVEDSEPAGRARTHVKREREKERENQPNPSGFGSVGSQTTRAAPRDAGGATRPASNSNWKGPRVPLPGEWESGDPGFPDPAVADAEVPRRMTQAEAVASIRETLDKAKQNVPGSRGKDTSFTKYDPSRHITPIQSAMMNGLDAE